MAAEEGTRDKVLKGTFHRFYTDFEVTVILDGDGKFVDLIIGDDFVVLEPEGEGDHGTEGANEG